MENTTYPLVSAIMLAGRMLPSDIAAAIDCFKAQTYPYKELIVVNNSKTHFDAASLNINAERGIFLVDTPSQLSAGMARNYGIASSNGSILAQFDADYWHAPNRLEAQIANLAENEAKVSMLTTAMAYSFNSGRASLYQNSQLMALGTMVFVRPHNLDYPNVDKQEELGLLQKLQHAEYKIITIPVPDLACKLYAARERNLKPINCGLTKEQFSLIKKIVKRYREPQYTQ